MERKGKERRKYVRANYPCKIIIYSPKEHAVSTHVENISAGGMKVVTEEKLKVSSSVGIEIYLEEEEEEPIVCKGKIVWAKEQKSSYQEGFIFYELGVEFYDINQEDRQKIRSLVRGITSSENDSGKD